MFDYSVTCEEPPTAEEAAEGQPGALLLCSVTAIDGAVAAANVKRWIENGCPDWPGPPGEARPSERSRVRAVLPMIEPLERVIGRCPDGQRVPSDRALLEALYRRLSLRRELPLEALTWLQVAIHNMDADASPESGLAAEGEPFLFGA